MRVGLVTAEFPPQVGGVGDHTARLAAGLRAAGHAVQVVTTIGEALPGDEWSGRGSRVDRIVDRWDWRILFTLPRVAIRQAWDVVHIHYQAGAYQLHGAICLLPRFIRKQPTPPAIVTTFHDLQVPYLFPKSGSLRRRIVQDMAQNCDGVIAVADETVGQLYKWTSGSGREVAVSQVPLGNHFDATPPAGFTREGWRAELGIGPNAWVIGHIGFVNASKAVDSTVAALAMLIAAGHDVHLLMIGQAASPTDPSGARHLNTILEMIEQMGLTERVHWTARVSAEDAVAWIRCVDVMSLPFRDGASLRRTSLIGSWANGVPVVTTDAQMPVDWLRGDAPAAVSPSVGPESLALTIEKVMEDPRFRDQLSTRGLALAERFAWPSVVTKTLDVYREARRVPSR
jgi:glycosyltransferase involved in cell wall biosynthesis